MKVRFNKATWRTAGAICASFVLVVSFQNCGKAGFDSSLNDSVNSSSLDAALTAKYGSSTAAKVTDIPFAFDGGFDQIAYNSCAESGTLATSTAYFGLKAGAYETSGLSLNSTFFDYADANFKPIYPATALSKAQYEEFLGDSPKNSKAQMMMAVRERGNIANVYAKTTSLVSGTDVIPLVDTLTSAFVMETLMTERGSASRFFPFSSGSRVMEASLKYNSDQSIADSFRSILEGVGQLALTYNNDSTDLASVISDTSTSSAGSSSTSSPVRTAYGKGYRFSFSQPTGVSNSYVPSNIVSDLQEVDLSTGNVVSSWNCSRVYKIVLLRDSTNAASGGYCPPHTAAELENATIRRELEIVRRQFHADQWNVNVNYKCMVPKGTTPSCYTENIVNGAGQGVQYSTTAECYNPLIGNSTADYPSGIIPGARCMNYATICTKF
ncbi:MAG: hypothetical protein ACM3MG_11995 [Bacillota bacterium]